MACECDGRAVADELRERGAACAGVPSANGEGFEDACGAGGEGLTCDDAPRHEGWGLHGYVLSSEAVPVDLRPERIAVLCVGNRLMLDDGIGPAVYDALVAQYDVPENVELLDLGCLSLAMIDRVREFDVILTVDAVDDSGEPAGTILRYAPDAMARHVGITASLHDLKLIDLFDSAALLGYQAEGLCLGMQVENASPAEATEGLTPVVHKALPLLVDVVAGELARLGSPLEKRDFANEE